MGTTSEKLTYLNDTKLALKDMINYGLDTGEKITSETTFRNYVKSLFDAFIKTMTYPDVLYENLPKVTGTGTSATLNGTAEAPMRNILSPSAISQDGEPSPSNSQDIHTVSGDNTVVVGNKNLFDRNNNIESTWQVTKENYQNGIKITSTSNSGVCYISYKFPFELTTQQDISLSFTHTGTEVVNMYFYDKDGNTIKSSVNNTTSFVISEVPTTVKSCRIRFYGSTAGVGTVTTYDNIQLEKSSTATTYVEHQEQNYPISLGDLEYCKIGDYEDLFFKNIASSEYYDSTLELNKWYLKKNIDKVVLDGSNDENWATEESRNTGNTFYATTTIIDSSHNTSIDTLYSNYFKQISNLWTSDIEGMQRLNQYRSLRFRILKTSLSEATINAFKTWLSTHNTEVYYVLQNPTFTLLSDTLQNQLENIHKALSYNGQTNVSQENNDLPFVINLSAIKDYEEI